MRRMRRCLRAEGMRTRLAWLIVGVMAVSGGLVAGQQRSPRPVQWRASAAAGQPVVAGAAFGVNVLATIAPGWHLYAMDEPEGGPIPTEFTAAEGPFELLSVEGDRAVRRVEPATGELTSFYQGRARFALRLRVRPDAATGVQDLDVRVRYQACNERMCLPPRSEQLRIPVQVRSK